MSNFRFSDLVIERVEAVPLRAQLASVFKFGNTDRSTSPNVVVMVHAAGLTGYGEACPVPAFTAETQQSIVGITEDRIAPALSGRDATRRSEILALLGRLIPGCYFTCAALDMALLDLLGKASGLPASALLGGSRRDSVEVHGSVGWEPEASAVVDNALRQQETYRWLKLYAGRGDLRDDLRTLEKVRDSLRDGTRLLLDVNGLWSLADYLQALPVLLATRIEVVEQPVSPLLERHLPSLDPLAGRLAVCADESVRAVGDIRRVAESPAVSVVNVGQAKVGGPSSAKAIAEAAALQGLEAMVGSVVELSISNAAGLHLAATLPSLPYPSYLMGPLKYATSLIEQPLEVRDGHVGIPTGPGLGLPIDASTIRDLDARSRDA